MKELPRYRCHKEVWALRISQILFTSGSIMIVPAENGFEPFAVSLDYVKKHNPQHGGYYVRYADGYESWSPAKAFEEGYTRID